MQTSLFRKSGQSINAPGTRPALTDMSARPTAGQDTDWIVAAVRRPIQIPADSGIWHLPAMLAAFG
jgi:hypothetical protein